jgi:hypothetical protein
MPQITVTPAAAAEAGSVTDTDIAVFGVTACDTECCELLGGAVWCAFGGREKFSSQISQDLCG